MWDSINLAKIKSIMFILACLTAIWGLRPGLALAQTPVEIGCDNGVGNVADLINNLNLANEDPDQETFILGENCVYLLTAPTTVDQSGLLISADLVIEGNGATIRRKSSPLPPHFRLIKISGGAEVLLKDLILTDGYIVTGGGGAILTEQGSTVRLDEVQLRNNTAKFGGAIATLGGTGETIVRGSLLDNNQALGGGGGIYTNSPLTISDGTTFIRNTARRDGGAISIDDRAVAVIEQSRFEQNQSLTEEGGGVYASGSLTVNQTEFISNTASLRGGGVNSAGNKTLIIESHFLRNQADKFGGAFYTTSPQVEVSQSAFIQNSAAEEGGAIISKGKSVLSDNRFIKNKAFEGAGLILTSDETSHLVNNLWVDNESDPMPDLVVIELGGNGAVVMHHNTIISRVPRNHGAVGIIEGELQAHNNIVINHSRPFLPRQVTGGVILASVISTHNLFQGHTPDELTTGNSNIEAAPLFVDPANDDFRLQANSPAIDKGLDVGVSIDLNGRPRPVGEGFDIGAYEFDPSPPPPDDDPTPEPQPDQGFTVYLPLVVK